MPKGYKQLTSEQRYMIQQLYATGYTQKDIALTLGVSPSTVCRELHRNRKPSGAYEGAYAHKTAKKRQSKASSQPKLSQEVRDLIEECLSWGWSPEQISGTLLKNEKIKVSFRAIYDYIEADRALGQNGKQLYKLLRHSGKRYKKRKDGKIAGRGQIPGRVDISQRPAVVETKTRVGDWEGDLMSGRNHKCHLVTLVDRHSKMVLIGYVLSKDSKIVAQAIIAMLLKVPPQYRKTLTLDNGKEFAQHKKITKALGTEVYFARPYRSCERGLNEHTNGLIREYLPKKTSFVNLDPKLLKAIEYTLNSRPRKVLKYKTPENVWERAMKKITTAS